MWVVSASRIRLIVGVLQAREFREWVYHVSEVQDSTPLFENPVFTVSELQERFEIVSTIFSRLNSKPPPKPIAAKAESSDEEPAAAESPADTKSSDSASDDTSTQPPHEELR